MEEYKYQTTWKPQEDITTFELAQCIPFIFSKLHPIEEWETLDESITRHFEVEKYAYGEMIRDTRKKLKALMEDDD